MDSLTVMRFLTQLRKDFRNSSLSLEFIIQNNTFRQLAAALSQASRVPRDDNDTTASDTEKSGGLLRLSAPSRAKRPKLFGLFGVDGLSIVFTKIATHLPSLDVTGIEKVRFGRPDKYKSIPDMANDHVRC